MKHLTIKSIMALSKNVLFYILLTAFSYTGYSQNNALDFDGVNDYVQLTGYKGVTGVAARTMEAWIKVPVGGEGNIVSWGTNASTQKWVFRVQTTNGQPGAIRLEVNGGYIVGGTDLRDNQWHHVACTWEDDGTPSVTDAKLYVDGVLETTSASLPWSVNTAIGSDVLIGAHVGALQLITGNIDELRIWNDVRTSSEILSNMCDLPNYVAETNLVSYFKFDQTTGTNLPDLKSSNNGALMNMTNASWISGSCTPMSFTSVTSTQNNTSDIQKCATLNEEIIGVEVVTAGALSPLDLTELRVQTTGSTNPVADITNIDVYYTGNSPVFATTTLFGSATPAATGIDILINGNQTLASGTNYFWVVYDMSATSTITNVVDALCNRVIINATNHIPTITTPVGSRAITACDPAPGGVIGLSSWFKASEDIYVDAGITPAVNNGDIVQQWNNLTANPNLPSVSKTAVDAQFLTKTHPYYNFNDVIEFTNDKFSRSIPYNAVFDPNDGLAVFTCASKAALSFTFTSSNTASPCGSNRCCTGYRWNGASISNGLVSYAGTTSNSNANVIGLWGRPGVSNSNNLNGVWSTGTTSNVLTNNGNYFYGIGSFPGYKFTGIITETFTYNRDLSSIEVNKIQSYMAVKYGVTLGVNGTSLDYLSSTGATIWNATNNSGYAYDVAGIARDDNSGLMQTKSHSVNNTTMVFDDIITAVNGNNFSSPTTIANNESFMMWGNNGLSFNCDSSDVGYTQGGLLIGERLERTWKVEEFGTIGITTLEFDMDIVAMGSLATSDYRLLIDTDGVFGNGSIALSASSVDLVNNKMYFTHDFTAASGMYFSIGIPKIDITIAGSTTICDGDSTQLTFNYTGTNGPIDITFFDGTDTITVVNIMNGDVVFVYPSTTTTYSTIVTSNSICIAAIPSIVTINVTPLPVVNIGPDMFICEDSIVTIDATQASASYLWQDNSTNDTYQPNNTGLYWVDVTVNSCVNRDSIEVLVNPLPVFVIEGEETVCNEPVTLQTDVLFQDYLWQDNSTDSILEITREGTYSVTVTDINGCQSYEEFTVTLKCPTELQIPNVFSPNGDGINDYFNAQGEFLESYNLQIFNRWGNLMFEGNSIEVFDGWNGNTQKGNEAPAGTYFCVISYSYFDEDQELVNNNLKGSVTLFR